MARMELPWASFRDLVYDTLKLPVYYLYTSQGSGESIAEQYEIMATDENTLFWCYLTNDDSSDFTEFESSYKALANLTPTDRARRKAIAIENCDGKNIICDY